jgi:hypothetical protein
LLEFMAEELPRRVPILARREAPTSGDSRDAELVWMHRTFAETLAAENAVATRVDNRKELAQLVGAAIRNRALGHPYALTLLAAISRAGRDEAVADALKECIEKPIGGLQPNLLALRALDAGIDAGGIMRSAQVRLLLRVLVTEAHESKRCAEIFSNDQLPSPWTIMKRPELRPDIVAALDERFKVRRARAGVARQIKVLKREAKILDELGLWSDFDGIARGDDAAAPRGHGSGPGTSRGADLRPTAGTTTLMVRRPDGGLDAIDVDAFKFINQLVHMERAMPNRFSGADLVSIAAKFIFDEEGGDGSPGEAQ